MTPGPNPRPKKDQHPRHDRQERTDAAQQARGAGRAQAPKHGLGEEREHGGEHVAAKALRRERRRRVAVVDVGEVVENGEVDGEDADLGAGEGEDGDDPGDGLGGGRRRPAEPEEAERQEGGLDACKVQAALRGGGQFRPVAPGDLVLVDAEQGGEDGADGDGGVDGADLLDGEAAGGEDERDVVEGHVQDAPGEGGPEGEEEDDGLGEEEVEGRREGEVHHLAEGGAGFVGGDFEAEAASELRLDWFR